MGTDNFKAENKKWKKNLTIERKEDEGNCWGNNFDWNEIKMNYFRTEWRADLFGMNGQKKRFEIKVDGKGRD